MNTFTMKDTIFDPEQMKEYIADTARELSMENTAKALGYAEEAHAGQKRKNSDIPYIYHPMNLACHALAMGIEEDEIIAACLLHDVVEDCGKTLDELPVNAGTKEIVRLMTREESTDETRAGVLKAYYGAIAKDPKAAMVKCLDRCNNLTTMSWGLSREKVIRTIKETEEHYPELLETVKKEPAYAKAAWLLQYQIESMLDIYKHLIEEA